MGLPCMWLSLISLMVFAVLFKSSIYVLSFSGAIIAVISAILTSYEAKKLIHYTFGELLKDIYKPILAALVMGIAVLVIDRVFLVSVSSIVIRTIVKISVGAAVYLGYSFLFKPKEFAEILRLLHIEKKDAANE